MNRSARAAAAGAAARLARRSPFAKSPASRRGQDKRLLVFFVFSFLLSLYISFVQKCNTFHTLFIRGAEEAFRRRPRGRPEAFRPRPRGRPAARLIIILITIMMIISIMMMMIIIIIDIIIIIIIINIDIFVLLSLLVHSKPYP